MKCTDNLRRRRNTFSRTFITGHCRKDAPLFDFAGLTHYLRIINFVRVKEGCAQEGQSTYPALRAKPTQPKQQKQQRCARPISWLCRTTSENRFNGAPFHVSVPKLNFQLFSASFYTISTYVILVRGFCFPTSGTRTEMASVDVEIILNLSHHHVGHANVNGAPFPAFYF